MKISLQPKLLVLILFITIGVNVSAQKLPVGVSFKRLFLDYQTLNGGDFGAFKDYTDGFEFGVHLPLSQHFMVNIPVKIGLGNEGNEIVNDHILGLDAQIHYYPIANPKVFKPYLLAGVGGVWRGQDSVNLQTPVGVGLDVKIAKYAYFNLQSEYRWSSAEGNSNFNHGIGFKYFFGKKEMDTIPVIVPVIIPPMDTDQDGILDDVDECPTLFGLAAFAGCPDTDGDGVQDTRDECPTVAGLLELQGCPDGDGDGVRDGDDLCPTVPGVAVFSGCPDTDGDGIEDSKDNCPTVKGIPAFVGCPDTDGDGTEDSKDRCPKTYGPISNLGCPVIEAADKEVLTFAMKAVQFQLGKATLVPESNTVLNQIANIMKKYPDYNLSIDGHTDNTGSAEVNKKLSLARAKACYDYLAAHGVAANRMTYEGFGPSKPIADNSTYTGRTLNRRVEFNLAPSGN
ncbi:MAG: OmpA family protein [Saprospiraceae bacterium]|nr:OmpA family protein [Saprospiraceae bacterium]